MVDTVIGVYRESLERTTKEVENVLGGVTFNGGLACSVCGCPPVMGWGGGSGGIQGRYRLSGGGKARAGRACRDFCVLARPSLPVQRLVSRTAIAPGRDALDPD